MSGVAGRGVIALYCGSLFEFSVYARFSRTLAEAGFPLVVITALASVHVRARRSGLRSLLIARSGVHCDEAEANKTLAARLEALHASEGVYGLFVWSRGSPQSAIVAKVADRHSIRTVFLEISALAPRLFFDPAGIDGDSLVYRSPELLDAYGVSVEEAAIWQGRQVESRRRPAAAASGRKTNFWFVLDWLGALGSGGGAGPKLSGKIKDRLFASTYKAAAMDTGSDGYYLLALQMDGQPDRPADYAVTRLAVDLARAANVELMAKAHPSDQDRRFLRFLLGLRAEGRLRLSMAPSFGMVERSACVITRNSAVGLEARLLGREVVATEPSLYVELSLPRLAALATRHMLEFDPKGTDRLSETAGRRLVAAFEASARLRAGETPPEHF